ncbi:MAG: type II toxin-antitoxin system RelE/ParE family toxin [Nitrospirae bacterium]|nr:type II toxin-antitoxin system RelE/ParE family toxin [Nitrospirota bacterium]
MLKHVVRWANIAENDLEAIIDFIANESPDAALKVLGKIRDKTSRLISMPQRGRIVPELRQQGIFIYHELVSAPWRIIYRVDGQTVYVLAVIDSRRNVEDILLDRFAR